MPKKRLYLLLLALFFIQGFANLSYAQEKASPFVRYSADISYGIPFYSGDFYSLFGPSDPYDGTVLAGQIQYNQSSIAGSFIVPWDYGLSFRFRAMQSIIYFSEQLAQVNFKNSMYDLSLMVQYQFSFKKFNTYIYLGGGYHISSDAKINFTVTETKKNNNYGEVQRISSTAGFGAEYIAWRQFSVFIEADIYLSGSDRLDGYNGFQPGELESPNEKNYFLRDKLVTGRAGVRVYFIGKGKLIAERPFDKRITSNYENPYGKGGAVKKDSVADDMPEELRKLGVKKKLIGYTLEVNRVMSVEELKRQKDSGEKVISSIKRHFPNAKVELLLESRGFTIHIGGFGSYKEAKSAVYDIKQFYGNALVKRHS